MNKFEQFQAADINEQLNLAVAAVNTYKGMIDTHGKRNMCITHAALAILTNCGSDRKLLVAVFDSGAHSINGVFVNEEGRACLSTMATVICDRHLSFAEYEEVFNKDIGPGWCMGEGCTITKVTPFDFPKEII